jgi:PAS domain S-box-containing protein
MHINPIENTIPPSYLAKWQGITDLLAALLHVPAVLIMRYELKILEVFISSRGDDNPYHVGEWSNWEGLYCKTVVQTNKPLLIPNALTDPLWSNNPDLELGMIAYLGFPICFPDGSPFGTICILDRKENHFSEHVVQTLQHFRDTVQEDLASIVSKPAELDLRSMFNIHQPAEPSVLSGNSLPVTDSFFHFLYTSFSDAIFYIDVMTLRIIAANESAQNLYGYTEEEFRMLHVSDLDHRHDAELVKHRIDLLTENDLVVFDITHVSKSGRLIDVELKLKVLDKNILIALVRDVTSRKKTEKKLKDLVDTKDLFLSVLSHDLKSSMNVIVNFAELLLKNYGRLPDSTQKDYCLSIHDAAQHTTKLLDNLLIWSELKSGSIEVKPVLIDVSELIDEVLMLMSSQALVKRIKLKRSSSKFDRAYTDMNMVSNVLQNLVSNALKYSYADSEVTISSRRDHDHLIIEVCDQGIGIPDDIMDELFSVDVVTSRNGTAGEPGSGIGLALCREMLVLCGGNITVENNKDKGCSFRVQLPCAST